MYIFKTIAIIYGFDGQAHERKLKILECILFFQIHAKHRRHLFTV